MTHRKVPTIQIDSFSSPDLSFIKLSPIYSLFDPLSFARKKAPTAKSAEARPMNSRKLTATKSLEGKTFSSPKCEYARSIRTAVRTMEKNNLKFPLKVKTPEAQLSRLKSFTSKHESACSIDFQRLSSPITQSIKKLNEASKQEARILTGRGKSTSRSGIEESYSLSRLMMMQKNPTKFKIQHTPSDIFPYLQYTPTNVEPLPSTIELETSTIEAVETPNMKKDRFKACDDISRNCADLQKGSKRLKSSISTSYRCFIRSFRMFKRHTQLVEVSNKRAGLYILREEIRKSKEARMAKHHK
mmetsp:Transcript_30203/g.53494  ORF Transcript_30203/g.53494 Transcript_30203/m.53494 type:complete len:300 (-) Transcript_30203:24-923(-)